MVRYQYSQPDEIIHLDIKKLKRNGVLGHRRISGDRSQRKSGDSWEYLHVCVETKPLPRTPPYWPMSKAKAATSACFLIGAAGWFERHGVTTNLVMTDNGSGYRSTFS